MIGDGSRVYLAPTDDGRMGIWDEHSPANRPLQVLDRIAADAVQELVDQEVEHALAQALGVALADHRYRVEQRRQALIAARNALLDIHRPELDCPALAPETWHPCALPDTRQGHPRGVHESATVGSGCSVWPLTPTDDTRWGTP